MIKIRMKYNYLTIPFLFLLCNVSHATAIYTEVGDAGALPATAQTTTDSTQTFNEIKGTLSPPTGDSVDMFKIYISGGGNFSAQTVGGAAFDTELYLFDSTGMGVYANDDTVTYLAPSVLPANNALTPTAAGSYYLAISQCCIQPLSVDGPIFQGVDNTNHLLLSGPTGVGGASSVTSFGGAPDQNPGGGAYTIFLTGAAVASSGPPQTTDVPEPPTFALMVAGLMMCGYFARRRRKLGHDCKITT